MNRIKTYLPCLLAISLVLYALSGETAFAQTTKQPDSNQTLESLLNEVRVLSKALQRTGVQAPRGQIILERMRAHQEQVVRLTRTLEEAREITEKTEATIPRFIEQSKLMEAHIERETDAYKRAQLEYELKEKKQAVERYKVGLERQREKEQQLSIQLRAEQTKLSELENRLDALEREMESEVEKQKREEQLQKLKQPVCTESEKRPG